MSERSSPDKGKAPEENLSDTYGKLLPFKKHLPDDDQTPLEKAPDPKWPGPKPRFSYLLLGPEARRNVPRTLNSREANPINPVLRLNDTFEACVVLDCPRFIDYSTRFQVFDKDNTTYNMRLLQGLVSGSIELVFDAEWERFVRDHNLKAGDEISFDKYLDTTISDDFYYILKYVKKPSDDADSGEKPRDDAESSRKESKDKQKEAEQSVPSIEMPVFKVIYHKVVLETPPDQEQRNAPRPGSRRFRLEASCLSKTLTALEVVQAKLYFDVYDAIILTDCPKIAELRPGDCSKEFLVFDGDVRRYKMTLVHHFHRGGIFGYCLNGSGRFLRNHNLKQGDQVAFYKFLDKSVSQGYYYVLKYTKQPADVDRNRKNPETPGSRALLLAFTKTLSPNEVAQGNAGLHLNASQARHFDTPHRISNDLIVFDANDRRYDMKLSYFVSSGEIICCLDGGWQIFARTHHLKAGDEVYVYKILDTSVCDDYCFVMKFTRC